MAKEVYMIGLEEFRAAINRNPAFVVSEARKFLTRGMAEYRRGITRNPWRVGGYGGGVPVLTGHLKDSHFPPTIKKFEAIIGPDTHRARYAIFVHEGTRRMRPRPWLDYVKKGSESTIRKLYIDMLENIRNNLAR